MVLSARMSPDCRGFVLWFMRSNLTFDGKRWKVSLQFYILSPVGLDFRHVSSPWGPTWHESVETNSLGAQLWPLRTYARQKSNASLTFTSHLRHVENASEERPFFRHVERRKELRDRKRPFYQKTEVETILWHVALIFYNIRRQTKSPTINTRPTNWVLCSHLMTKSNIQKYSSV